MSPGGMVATPLRSAPLHELLARPDVQARIAAAQAGAAEGREILEPELPHPAATAHAGAPGDGALQGRAGTTQPTPTGVSFDGGGVGLPGFTVSVAPPDTEGRVGPNHYVQWVNIGFQIFDKAGNLLAGPFPGNVLWTGFGSPCQTFNNGDPIAEYDLMADRWVLTQFVVGASPAFSHQCVAVSASGDPLGAYYLYDFVTDAANFVDYPHWGVWPDSYYMTAHLFNAAGNAYLGQDVFAYDRASMLAGLPAGVQGANVGTAFGGALPTDLDSILPPPPGTPNGIFAPGSPELDGSPSPTLHEWAASATWGGTPSFSVVQQPDIAGVASFNGQVCTNFTRNCVPQSGTTQKVDVISDRLMYRIAYRNFGDHDAYVLSHTVNPNPFTNPQTLSQAAQRWYEIRSYETAPSPQCAGGYPCLFQQGTFSPDTTNFRWMGSIAMDASGDMALGYSNSSSAIHPQINITGRLAADPPGTMGSEALMMAGGGSQTTGLNRWGDYSDMTVDPKDGCTFWYTQEYLKANGTFNWSTRVASFAYPNCAAEAQGTLQGTVTDCATGEPVSFVLVSLSNGFSGVTDAAGHYSITVAPGSYEAQASQTLRDCSVSGPFPVTITQGQATTQDFCITGTPRLAYPPDTLLTEGQLPWSWTDATGDGKISPVECATLSVSIENIGCADDSQIFATLSTSTPGVTLPGNVEPFPDLGISAVGANSTPFVFETDATYDCRDIDFTLTLADRTGPAGTLPIHIAAPCPASPATQTFSGSITNTDSTQNSRMGRFVNGTTCAGAGCPGASGGAGTRFFDTYTYSNPTGGPACITVNVTPACDPGGNPTGTIQSVAYLNAYNPASICQNYLGDWGFPGGGNPNVGQPYSFKVPPFSNFVVEINGVAVGSTCPFYSGVVSGFVDTTPANSPCAPCPAIGLSPATLPNAGVGSPYNATLTASGGAGGTQFFLTSGALPPGLTLASNGQLSGTTSAPGTYGFTVTATDSNGCSGSQSYVIDVFNPCGGDWQVTTAFVPNVYGVGASGNGTVAYVGGGFDLGLFAGNQVFASYDPAGDLWTTLAPIPDNQAAFASVVYSPINNKVYVFGGYDNGPISDPSVNLTRIYDVGSDSWSLGTPMPAGRQLGNAIAVNGLIYVIGGSSTDIFDDAQNNLWVYDPAADSWDTSKAPFPSGVATAFVGAIGNQIIVAGGWSPGLGAVNNAYAYDIAGNTWNALPAMPAAAAWGGSAVLNNTLWTYGGGVPFGPTPAGSSGGGTLRGPRPAAFSATSIFDPATGLWSAGPGLNVSRSAIGGTDVGNFALAVAGTDLAGTTELNFQTGFIWTPATLPDATVEAAYTATVSAAGGTGATSYAVTGGSLPPALAMDSAGNITGTSTAAGTFSFVVTATDSNGCTGDALYTITAVCPAITVFAGPDAAATGQFRSPAPAQPVVLPTGFTGTPYDYRFFASGGTAPYVFAVSAGTLPAGISVDPSTGIISGTPTATGIFPFTITATDSFRCAGSQDFVLEVDCGTMTLGPAALANTVLGAPYSQTLVAAGATPPYIYSVGLGALPPGLSLNSATGVLSGAATALGNYFFIAAATAADGCLISKPYVVSVSCAAINLTPTSLPGGSLGTPYSQTLVGSGGTAPYAYSFTGLLPNGLTLDPATGVLSGTPAAAGVFTFTVTATDANGCSGSLAYTVTISCAAITVTPASLPNAQTGVAYSQTIAASGGTAPYTFTAAGAVPPGLSLDPSTGLLSGTPTAAGTYGFTVTATDANGCTGTATYVMTVSCAAINLTPAGLPDGVIGVAYSQTIGATGGTAPYTFTASGAVPPGLSLNPTTGVLSGTPTAAGTYGFTVTATDANGCFGSAVYVVRISCAAITVTPASLPNAQTGVAYSQTIAASGGTAPYTFTATGAVPPGLSLNPTTGVLSGTPTAAGTYGFTVTATDANGCTGSATYVVTVSCAAIALAPAGLPAGTPGAPYNATITASGGTAPYVFAATGTLPPGLLMDSAGSIAGTPTALGSYSFLVTATDTNGCVGTALFTILISPISVTGVDIHCGPAAGGTTVTISGNNFVSGATVKFLDVPATNVVFVDSSTITADTPPSAPGAVGDITVINPDGDTATLADGWGYDFLDVPTGNPFHPFVCNLVRHHITAGCGTGDYCPGNPNLRNQMAVFIMRSVHGPGYVPPPASGTMFSDVPANAFGAAFIEESAREGVMGVGEDTSCGAGRFCPADAVTRLSMAYILLRGEHGGSYIPPAANCGTFPFVDVPCPSPDADWVSELVAEGITAGCDATHYCPTNPVTRAQMAVFITVTFNLQ